MNLLRLFIALLPAILPVAGSELFNGNFQRAPQPDGWEWNAFGDSDAKQSILRDENGNRFLRIVSCSPRRPNSYAQLYQNVPLVPDHTYLLNFKVWGQPAANANWTLGKNWKQRRALPEITPEPRTHQIRFRADKEEFDGKFYPLRLIVEGSAPELNIDDVSIVEEPAPLPEPTPVTAEQALTGKAYRLPRIAAGPAADFPSGLPVWKLPADADPDGFDAGFTLGWSERGLLLFVRVRDRANRPVPNSAMYTGDSIQLRIDQDGSLSPEAAPGDLELGFSIAADGTLQTWNWNSNAPIPPAQIESLITPEPGGYFAAILLKAALFPRIDFRNPKPFSFNLLFNDRDNEGRRRVFFFASGIHDRKSSEENVMLLPGNSQAVVAAFDADRELLTGTFYLSGTAELALRLKPESGPETVVPLRKLEHLPAGAAARVPFRYDTSKLAPGSWNAELLENGNVAGTLVLRRGDRLAAQRNIWEKLNARNSELKTGYGKLFPERLPSEADLAFRVLDAEIPRLLTQFAAAESPAERRFYAERGEMTRPEVEDALNDLERGLVRYRAGRVPPEYWLFQSGPVTLRNGFPHAELAGTRGRRQFRPVLFGGYGHFDDVIRELPQFPGLGANIIQIEIGPSSIFPREGKNGEFSEPDFTDFDNRILAALKSASESNVKVCLLLSPHYHPAWLLEKYPDMRADSDFLKYEITHPKADELLDAYIAAVVPRLKASKWSGALHSLVISNEPVYIGCSPANPASRKAFRSYLEAKFGTIQAFNAAAGRNTPGFDALLATIEDDPAVKVEFERFRRDTFADWHRRLAERIRRCWPEIPLHAKMMVFSSLYTPQGTDSGKFAAFSDYNGNDNYKMYETEAPHHYVSCELGSELQISARKLSICNSENHIIVDGETRPIPNGHIYTALFQQYAGGASALITWVWVDLDFLRARNLSTMFGGNIRNRPGNVIAHGRAVLDANRVAAELQRFAQYEPETAILHAPTSLLFEQEHYRNSIGNLYAATLPTGHRVRFLSEEQLKAREFGRVRLLLLPEAEYIDREAMAGLAEFKRRGGRILACGKAPRFDEFGNPLPPEMLPELPELPPGRLTAELDATTPLPVKLRLPDGVDNRELFFRCVPDGDTLLINLVNYGKAPVTLKLEGDGAFYDLLEEQAFEPAFELPPLKPLLLRFSSSR